MEITPRPIHINFSPTRFGDHIRLIVLHTEDGYEDGTASWFNNPAAEVSAHYGVRLAGGIDQFVAEGDTAWHAGNWKYNTGSIGIETEDDHNPNSVQRPASQYDAVAHLVADICRRYNLPCDRAHVIRHGEVPDATHPNCPGNLDVDLVVAKASELLQAHVAATVTAVGGVPGIVQVNEEVEVTVPTLIVRRGPGTQFQGGVGNTPDGNLHEGQQTHLVGYVHGQDVDYSATGGAHTDIWGETVNSAGEHHWVWTGGTTFHLPPGLAEELPVPNLPAPEEHIPDEYTEEATSEAVAVPVKVIAPKDTFQTASGVATLHGYGRITDFSTGQDVAQIAPQDIPVGGTVLHRGTLYILTPTMVKEGRTRGINVKYFKSQDTATPKLADTPKKWHPVLRLLHLFHK